MHVWYLHVISEVKGLLYKFAYGLATRGLGNTKLMKELSILQSLGYIVPFGCPYPTHVKSNGS